MLYLYCLCIMPYNVLCVKKMQKQASFITINYCYDFTSSGLIWRMHVVCLNRYFTFLYIPCHQHLNFKCAQRIIVVLR